MTDHFARLWALGYKHLVPIIPPGAPISERSNLSRRIAAGFDDRGKVPGMRWEDGQWSGFKDWLTYQADERDMERWHAWGANVGMRTGGPDGVHLIDADTLSREHAYAIKAEVEKIVGPAPLRVGRKPKAGYVIRLAEPIPYCRVEFDGEGGKRERVEILGHGRQFVAEGMHPCGLPYEWKSPLVELERLTIVTPAQIDTLLERLRSVLPTPSPVIKEGVGKADTPQERLRGDPTLVRKAVGLTPNTSALFPSRESYRDMGYAIKASMPDEAEAYEVFADWCARWSDGTNDPEIVAADWKRMKPPYRRGASWLYELAEKHGDGSFTSAEQWFQPILADPVAGLFPAGDESSPKPQKRLTLVPIAEAAASALTSSTRPLIDGLLDQGAMTVLYGESGSGKTFVTMDMAYHVAAGREWGGMKVEQFAVVYVAAEGGVGARKRAAALRKKFGGEDVPFWFILSPVDLLRPDADLPALVSAVIEAGGGNESCPKPFKVGLVIIDTASRAMAGGDENSSTDMGALVKHLDALRAATGAHLIVVHHSGKDRAKGARGHSLLRAATDTEIEVAERQIVVTKQRDLETSFSSAFDLEVVDLGVDGSGRRVTSCTVRLMARNEVTVGVASPREQDVLDAIGVLLSTAPGDARSVSTAEIVEYLKDDSNFSVETIRSGLRRLSEKHLVRNVGRGKWTTCPESHFDKISETGLFS